MTVEPGGTAPRGIVVTGSVAIDHLFRFGGRITDQLLPEHLKRLSLSLLADDMQVRPGGVAGNIGVGLRHLGIDPVVVAAVGHDFGDYGAELTGRGLATRWLHVCEDLATARFLCTSDDEGNQLATFYPGAMTRAAGIDLSAAVAEAGPGCLVLVGPNDPGAMVRYTAFCRQYGYAFAADPSQQLAVLDAAAVRSLIEGAELLFTNEYERALLLDRTGWSVSDVLQRTGAWVTTYGAGGVEVERLDRPPVVVGGVATSVTDPTGAGDALRAGFLAAVARAGDDRQAARIGCGLASLVLGHPGGQQYRFDRAQFTRLLTGAYGAAAAAEFSALCPGAGG